MILTTNNLEKLHTGKLFSTFKHFFLNSSNNLVFFYANNEKKSFFLKNNATIKLIGFVIACSWLVDFDLILLLPCFRLRASDDDSATPFVIDEDTGVISITSALDRELTPRYDLVVEARDGGEASEGANQMKISNCHVIVDVVDVNDNPPMFMSSSYQATISEGLVLKIFTKAKLFIKI